jgi:hypothetical protein
MRPVLTTATCACSVLLGVTGALQGQRTELRLAGILWPAGRTVAHHDPMGGTVPTWAEATSTLRGAELVARGPGAGIMIRYSDGGFGAGAGDLSSGNVRSLEGVLLGGPRQFSIQAGYVRYSYVGLFEDGSESLFKGGVQSWVPLGPSGLTVHFAGAVRLRWGEEDPSGERLNLVGWDASTGVLYQAPRGLPFFIMFGYELTRHKPLPTSLPEPTLDGLETREELRGVFVRLGVRYVK